MDCIARAHTRRPSTPGESRSAPPPPSPPYSGARGKLALSAPGDVSIMRGRFPAGLRIKERPLPTAKSWHLLPHDPIAIERLARSLGLSTVVAQLLINRGLTTPDAAV